MPVAKRVELVTTGEELLLGLTANSHLSYIGRQLAKRGLALARNVVVNDDADAIAEQFRECWARADLVITTGGLGPTCDDRTREVLAEILGQQLVFDGEIEAAIRQRFAAFGRKMTANNLKQAYRPERSEALPNANGTAPGIWVEQDGRILVMLPGPPNELVPMFEEQVVPRLIARGFFPDEEAYLQIRTAGVGESALETLLRPVFADAPGLGVAFCAHQGAVDVRLSSPDGRYSRAQLQIFANRCRERLGYDFVCFGDDSLVKIVSDQLRNHDLDIAVAESCTGGLLSNAFTDLCGASKIFNGGIVCYSNDCKVQLLDVPECLLKQHGAVSAEAAAAMASGVAEILEASFGLAVTGFAGPCGGTKENPVGTIYLGLHTPHGVWSRKVSYPGSRVAVKQRAVNAALDWLRRELIRAGIASHAGKSEPTEDPARVEARRLMEFGNG
ncbi:competence/damage-inducible protein A [Opitutales bacterium ASA1]|uniref:competence/damage-inducible protein A n=1 Tax=Congregicoccus parvus TaxID=3081749 RepID=UPI002B321921|nr:competence/damage-inducible protein A [Opitutales bacterium ASA1]